MNYKYWFASVMKVSGTKKYEMINAGYTPEEIYCMNEKELLMFCSLFEVDPHSFIDAGTKQPCLYEDEELQKKNISFVTIQDAGYPEKLKRISNPPYALFYKGKLPKNQVAAAVVGARKCSEYGRVTAEKIGRILAENQIPVISGLALGIDSAGHLGALKGGGKTYAVLGCGPDVCYPKSAGNLYRNILGADGGMISEYLPGTNPLPVFFPARNRIISGLADLVIVVEARKRSGSLITADFALEQGKEIFAVPGRCCDPLSQGTNHLIYQGAGILHDLDMFLEDCNLKLEKSINNQNLPQLGLEKEEQLLYSCLDLEPKYLDIIIEETGLSLVRVLNLLYRLQKRGVVRECYKNYFSKKNY